MAKIGLNLKINVSQIEKARLFKGDKGTYLDATIFVDIDQADQYGNHGMITQDVSKEEKDSGVKGPILGNGRVFWREQVQPTDDYRGHAGSNQGNPAGQAPALDPNDFDDDIPF